LHVGLVVYLKVTLCPVKIIANALVTVNLLNGVADVVVAVHVLAKACVKVTAVIPVSVTAGTYNVACKDAQTGQTLGTAAEPVTVPAQ
ncbi:10332_t:CDS:2, partial [Paraglomus occultum]